MSLSFSWYFLLSLFILILLITISYDERRLFRLSSSSWNSSPNLFRNSIVIVVFFFFWLSLFSWLFFHYFSWRNLLFIFCLYFHYTWLLLSEWLIFNKSLIPIFKSFLPFVSIGQLRIPSFLRQSAWLNISFLPSYGNTVIKINLFNLFL